ncbi:MAG: hypothetical protein RR697_03620 [Malacoplasma sp.]
MTNLTNNITVSSNEEGTIFGLSIPIQFEEKDLIGDIEKINFTYIKYVGKRSFREDNNTVEKFFIEFINMPVEIIKELAFLINEEINIINQKRTIAEILQSIMNLFSKHKLEKKLKKDFKSDLLKAIFILDYKNKFNFDLSKYFALNDDQSDFYINELDKHIFLKPSKKNTNQIKLTEIELNKIDQISNFDFYVAEFDFISDKTNILEIYEQIGLDSSYIQGKHKYWKDFSLANIELKKLILETETVDLNGVNIFKINNDCFPKVTIVNIYYVDSFEITLNTSELKIDALSSLKEINNSLVTKQSA